MFAIDQDVGLRELFEARRANAPRHAAVAALVLDPAALPALVAGELAKHGLGSLNTGRKALILY